MKGYTRCVKHGEEESGSGAVPERSGADNHEEGDEDEDEHDMFITSPLGGEMVDVESNLLQDMLRDVEYPAYNKRDSMKLNKLVSDSATPLYAGCKPKHTKLSATLELMKLKASSGWTNKTLIELLGIMKTMIPEENTLPETTYEAKQVLCPLGLEVRRIRACPNDCVLHYKQYADLDACTVCKASRYKRKKGLKQPGNDINVFLEPVVDDLEILWKEGVETWDADSQENFNLRVLLFSTINDYPALSNLSGQTMKGKKACSDCLEHTRSRWLKKSRKMVYMGHRRWLPLSHAFRRKKKIFNGKRELQSAPRDLFGEGVHNMVKDITNEFGKKRKRDQTKDKGMWKKKSIFWRLTYWKDLEKIIDPENLDGLQSEIVNTLCHMEMYLPLSFFDIMIHLPVHLVKQTKLCGPVFLREMWSFERYIGVLKSYVRNRAKLEGSIIEGYKTEEAIKFCVDYMSEDDPIGVPASRHEGRLLGVGIIGRKRIVPDQDSYAQAHFAVLQHMAEVTPYFEEHLEKVQLENMGRSDTWINREHSTRFIEWFKNRIARLTDGPSELLQRLARGPCWDVDTWQGYDINGYTFYTTTQDEKSTVQNSSIRIDAYQDQSGSNICYGRIQQIWELNYVNFKVSLFRCTWVNIRTGVKVDKEGFTLIDLAKIGYVDEPFVLAKQVQQIFYVQDPANKRRIVGVDNVVDEEEYNKSLHVRPQINIEDNPEDDVAYACSDHSEGISL
ncbi:uncharacterized protein LOC102699601 [Oryza brachyantha]|uniref:uncharacterized protein LOC102699601 n=1 Tax=Oryza brachyantha TaxID=4533 RepID=UPI0007760946|nr:uncharacterized protein LOC102699601 [Oryza brachyantha]